MWLVVIPCHFSGQRLRSSTVELCCAIHSINRIKKLQKSLRIVKKGISLFSNHQCRKSIISIISDSSAKRGRVVAVAKSTLFLFLTQHISYYLLSSAHWMLSLPLLGLGIRTTLAARAAKH